MHKFGYLLLALPLSAIAQGSLPVINTDGIVRADTNRPGLLPPGMVFSIYGRGLGPESGCTGRAPELCAVRVLVDGVPIEVQYAQENQVNARMPDTVPSQFSSQLVVVSGGRSSAPVEVRRGAETATATISLDGVARVNSPVWIHVEFPAGLGVSYPSMVLPWDFGCDSFEVRRDGKRLTPLPHPVLAMTYSGLGACPGTIALGHAEGKQSRLPLHLQYRFDQPGVYEVRLSHSDDFFHHDDIRIQTAWTPVEVLPAVTRMIGPHPQEPAEILSSFLPDLLALPDDASLSVILEYLYHPDRRVRAYAANALFYWPESFVKARVAETLRNNGPAPLVPAQLLPSAAELLATELPYLSSDDPVLFQGAIAAARDALSPNAHLTPELRARVEQSLIAAAGNLGRADAQTVNDFIAVLGGIKSDRVHDLLWSFANSQTGTQQALIAIAWQKEVTDLSRFADWLIAARADGTGAQAVSGVPYQMRTQFGDAALPWLRTVLDKAANPDVRINCAEELMRANDPAGFAFAQDAFEQNRPWKAQIRQMVNDQFPETRNKSASDLADFLRTRSK